MFGLQAPLDKDGSILQLLLVDNSKSYEKPKAVQRRREKRFKLC